MKKQLLTVLFVTGLAAFDLLNGQAAAALNFDGTNDYVSVPNSTSLNITGTITLEAWVYATKPTGIQNGMCKSSSGPNTGYIFPRTDNGWTDFVAYFYIGGVWRTLSAPYGGLNQWHHLAATYDGTNIRLYKDGLLVATSPNYPGTIASNLNGVTIGNQPGFNEYYGGTFDECRIWNVVRSQTQIQSTMNCETDGNESGLVLNMHFNQGIAAGSNSGVTTAFDTTANANNGTLMNFALSGSTSNWIAPGGVVSGMSCNCATVVGTLSSQVNVSCFGGSDGSATVSATGGTSFTYSWAPSGGTAATATGLSPGTYTCTITNECFNDTTVVVTITQPTQLTLVTTVVPTSCGNFNGSSCVSASGGTPPYSYFWSPSGNTTACTNNLPPGTYTVLVSDANGCTAADTIAITASTSPSVTASVVTNVSCSGGNDGSALASATGGAGGYLYAWSPTGGTDSTATLLTGGNYTVTITDMNGCTAFAPVTITEPPAIVVNVDSTNVTCNGDSTGSIDLTVTGGVMPYTFDWNNGQYTTEDLFNLAAGVYSGVLTDANGCTSSGSINITEPPPLAVSFTSAFDTVCQSTAGQITLNTGTPGGGIYSGSGMINDSVFDPMMASVGYNVITYMYTDTNNCSGSAMDSIYVDLCLGEINVNHPAFIIYPNPTNGEVIISGNIKTGTQIRCYATDGKLVNEQVINAGNSAKISLLNQPAGIYLVQITDENHVTTLRVVLE